MTAPERAWRRLPMPLLVLDGGGTIVGANAAAAKFFGHSLEALVGAAVDTLVTGPGRVALHTFVLPRVRDEGELSGVTLPVRAAGGDEVQAQVFASVDDPSAASPQVSLALLPPRDGRRSDDELLRLRRAADASPAVLFEYVIEADGRGRFPYASAALLSMFGLTPEQVRDDDRPLLERVHPDQRDALIASRQAAAAARSMWTMRCRAGPLAPNPGMHFGWRAMPRDGVDGSIVWHGYIGDATGVELERLAHQRQTLKAEAARLDAERFARLVADSLPGRVAYWDRDLVCRFANRQFCEWLGKPREAVVGAHSTEALGAERERALWPHISAALAGGTPVFERQDIAPDGTVGWRLVHFLPDRRDGEVQGFVVLGTDVTSIKHAESQLRELNGQLVAALDEAEAAARAKSAFLANMSHEIRTPMNAIVGLTHLLAREARDARQRDRLGKVDAACRHLLQIINDVLDLSKIEAGAMVLESVDFSTDALVSGAVDLVGGRAREKGLELVLDLDGLPARLRGDPTRLSQAFVNLLSNAVKFTSHGWIRLQAEVLERQDDRLKVRFSVTDTGEGIAAQDQQRIFGAFEQADVTTTRRHGGTGLGLAITRHLAHLMGGEVGLRSTAGQGSTFWFTAELGTVVEEGAAAPASLRGLRALIVDDLPEALAAIEDRLRHVGMTADGVDSGPAALDRVRAELAAGRSYDVLLIDWRMAPLDGAQTLIELRSLLGAATPPAILVSASDEPAMWHLAQASGFGATIVKPLTASSLNDALARVLQPHAPAGIEPRVAGEHERALRRDHAGRRVLLAEDNPVNQEVGVELLHAAGLVVDVAGDGLRAVEYASARSYDIVLMDVQMPGIDGMAAAHEIRLRRGAALPIVAMTANAFGEDRAACLAAGMNDHVAKPVDPEVLYAVLLRWLPPRDEVPPSPAVTPPEAVTPLAERLEHVAGLDVAAGLRNVGGNLAVFERMLRRFIATYPDGLDALTRAADPAEQAASRAACHSLRGACAAVGAVALAAELAGFELALASSHDLPLLQANGQRHEASLRAMVAGLRAALVM